MLGYRDFNLDFWRFSVCMCAMNLDLEQLTPPKRLALAYARRPEKEALALLLLFDVSLGHIVQRSNEPLIGQMRLAWWRGRHGEAYCRDAKRGASDREADYPARTTSTLAS